MQLGADLIFSLVLFKLFCSVSGMPNNDVVALLTCRSGAWPCRELRKGNNATLCPDLSLPSQVLGSSQTRSEQGMLCAEAPLLSGVIATRQKEESEMCFGRVDSYFMWLWELESLGKIKTI